MSGFVWLPPVPSGYQWHPPAKRQVRGFTVSAESRRAIASLLTWGLGWGLGHPRSGAWSHWFPGHPRDGEVFENRAKST